MPDRYPLSWPPTWPRTPATKRTQAQFKVSFRVARDELLAELDRLGSPMGPIKPHVLACDRWLLVRDNIRAIGLHVQALRGMERWGVGSLSQAFAGYQALPEQAQKLAWWEILKVSPDAPLTEIKACYRQLAQLYHPDTGGSSSSMAELNRAYEEAQRSRRR